MPHGVSDDARPKRVTSQTRRCTGPPAERERGRNRTKSKVRAKVEHPFRVIKGIFGFTKVRYRGLNKNAARLFVTCALDNVYLVRRLLASLT